MNTIVAYIQKELQKGFSEQLIRKKLENAGYTEEEISTAFHDFETKQHYHNFVQTSEEKPRHIFRWILIIILLLIIVGGIIFIPKYFSINWSELTQFVSQYNTLEPTTEMDCQGLEYKEYEQCLLILAASYDNITYCTNITSKVMKYECRTSVWNKNPCNYLLLTGKDTSTC